MSPKPFSGLREEKSFFLLIHKMYIVQPYNAKVYITVRMEQFLL